MAVLVGTRCGKRGNPLPPLRPTPAAVGDLTARWIDNRVELGFVIPTANADGTTPPALERVEVYGVAGPAGTAPPTAAQITDARNLKSRIAIRPTDAPPPDSPGAGPAPGDPATFVDDVSRFLLLAAAPAGAPTVHYVVVSVAGSRRTMTAIVAVPLEDAPPAPGGLALSYDEKQVTFTWTPAGTTQAFRAYEVDRSGEPIAAAIPLGAPLTSPTFTTTVTFDTLRCFTVRAVRVAGPVSAEGPAAYPACITPVDTFPPASPTGVFAAVADGAVNLSWDPVAAADLGGYLILRGDATDEKLQPITSTPVLDTAYKDATVRAGATYVYAIVAVDKAKNQSGESRREVVTVR
jgi:hypothetical protein